MSPGPAADHELRLRVASHVRKRRIAAGLTQVEFADASGIDVRHIQKIERGEVNLTLRTLARLALALSVDPSELVSCA